MKRIESTLAALHQQGRKALIPYIVAGDPKPEITLPFLHTLVDKGADIIELGVPFSDPMAEGPVIARAHERALEQQMSLQRVIDIVGEFRRDNSKTPIVLMGYANPIEAMGAQAFAQAAAAAGVDGVLTVDLPPEEAAPLNRVLQTRSIDTIFLIAPTTEEARIKQICSMATGYIYYVSLKGVTGAGNLDISSVEQNIARIRKYATTPVCVGFGIKDAESAARIGKVADGVVVGSSIVTLMGEGDVGLLQAENLLGSMRAALS